MPLSTSMSPELIEATGFLAGFLTTVSFLPQLIAVFRRKSSKDLSWGYLLTFATGITFWLIYGSLLHSWPVILTNAITLVLVLGIAGLKCKYD